MGEHKTMGKSDGVMNTTIGDMRKTIDDEFNNNIRRFIVNKYSGPRMTVQPQKNEEQSECQTSGLNLQRQDCQYPQNKWSRRKQDLDLEATRPSFYLEQ